MQQLHPSPALKRDIFHMAKTAEQCTSNDHQLWRDCVRKRCQRAGACTGGHSVCFPIHARRGRDPQELWDACWDYLDRFSKEYAAKRDAREKRRR